MEHATDVLFSVFIVFVAAQIGAEIAGRLRMPAVVGEIAAGIVVGPSVLDWIEVSEPLAVLAEIGAVLLLFSVGLETRLGDLRRVGNVAAQVGVAGVALPFVFGVAYGLLAGYPIPNALFLASAFVATSAGITARVLYDLKQLQRIESRVILSAAVIDDILAMLLLGMVTAVRDEGGVHLPGLVLVFVQAIGFVALIALVGTRMMRRGSPLLEAPINPHSPLTISLAICLGLAAVAAHLGLAAIIGAFLAGMVASESRQRRALERQIQPILAFLVPFFFVVTGTEVLLSSLANRDALVALVIITALAIASKLAGGAWGARTLGRRPALAVGIGMVPRGEVGIIVASLGLQARAFDQTTYAIIIAMSLITSIIAPPFLGRLLPRDVPPTGPESDESAEDDAYLYRVDSAGHG